MTGPLCTQAECRQAMRDAYQAWRSHHHQLELVTDEPSRSGAGPTPAKSSETHLATHGSSFRQSPQAPVDARVPGPRHLSLAPDPRVPVPIPLPEFLEALT